MSIGSVLQVWSWMLLVLVEAGRGSACSPAPQPMSGCISPAAHQSTCAWSHPAGRTPSWCGGTQGLEWAVRRGRLFSRLRSALGLPLLPSRQLPPFAHRTSLSGPRSQAQKSLSFPVTSTASKNRPCGPQWTCPPGWRGGGTPGSKALPSAPAHPHLEPIILLSWSD